MGDLMKRNVLVVASLFAAACGGKAKPPKAAPPPPPPPAEEAAAPAATPEPEPPKPEPPKEWHAKAELTPVKGAKMKAIAVSLSQTAGESLQLSSEAPLEGLKVGKYHLVIHEAADCGPNATKAGAAWPDAVEFDVAKGKAAALQQSDRALSLDGEKSVVGHTLVLHDDKKGKPGKALACGAITSADAAATE
jgi:Cu/Zn superoxide dismutase